jgi:hypothetical protein
MFPVESQTVIEDVTAVLLAHAIAASKRWLPAEHGAYYTKPSSGSRNKNNATMIGVSPPYNLATRRQNLS